MSRAVIDQPGLRVTLVGLFISLSLGLILKSQISPARVQVQLQKAVSRLEKDFIVDFEEAHINLANWGLPWPRLEINRVRLSPKKNSCQSSQIFIEQIEIPLSWSALLFSQSIVDVVRAHNVELRIGDLENCIAASTPSAPAAHAKKIVGAALEPSNESNLFQRPNHSQLKEIIVDQLKVIIKDQSQQPLAFRQLHIQFDYESETLASVTAQSQLLAIKDSRTDTYFLVSDLNVKFKAQGKKDFTGELSLKGRMLDGDLQLTAQYNSALQKVAYELATHQVSIRAFLPLIQLGENRGLFDQWPVGITLNVTGDSIVGAKTQHSVHVKKFEVIGEQTLIQTEPIEIEVTNNEVKPGAFKAAIVRFPLNQLRGLQSFKNSLNSFEDVGQMKGDLVFNSDVDWRLGGVVEGTRLIFSNRGTREIQTIDSIQFQASSKNNLFSLALNDFQVNQSLINGQLEAHYNPANKNLTAQMQAAGHILNARIWKQLTQIEQSPDLKLNWTYKKSLDERQQVSLSTPKINFEGIEVNDLNIDFVQGATDDGTRTLALSAKAASAEIAIATVKSPIVLALFNADTGLTGTQYLAHRIQLGLKGSHWKSMKFDFDLDLKNHEDEKQTAKLKAGGGWNEDNSIDATAVLINGAKQIKFAVIRSGQDDVILSPLKSANQ